jgi:hypothetical protein
MNGNKFNKVEWRGDHYAVDVSTPKYPHQTMLIDEHSWADIRKLTTKRVCVIRCGKNNNSFYAVVAVGGSNKYVHRLAFHHHGRHTDHVNGNGLDNRLSNLRPATHSQNYYNARARVDNTTGVKGVHAHLNGYRASIAFDGKRVHLGTFKTVAEATAARHAAEQKYHGEYAGHGTQHLAVAR